MDQVSLVTEPPQPKKTRGNYVNVACYECKRRKTKCDSRHPCGRCATGGKKCVFPQSASRPRRRRVRQVSPPEGQWTVGTSDIDLTPRRRQSGRLPAQAARASQRTSESSRHTLIQVPHLETPRGGPSTAPPASSDSEGLPELYEDRDVHTSVPTISNMFPGSASSQAGNGIASESPQVPAASHYKFNINLARTNLRSRGILGHDSEDNGGVFSATNAYKTQQGRPVVDPIWLISRQEAERLCNVYEEEINISHPFVNMPAIRSQVRTLYDSLEALTAHRCSHLSLANTAIIEPDDLKIVKMVFATALITETSGESQLAASLVEDVRFSVRERFWETIDTKTIIIFFLLAMWQFLVDNDSLAWRLTGVVARFCLEIGLNKCSIVENMPGTDEDRKMAIRLFWCVHALDRRWGFGNGLPFVIQDSDIDSNLPEPDGEVPYLGAMVGFSRIASSVWYATYSPSSPSTALSLSRESREKASYLDYQITKWWDELPEHLQLGKDDERYSRGVRRLRILLYLRRCQLKILLHQPVLHSRAHMQEHIKEAENVVQLARDVIWKLDDLHRSTDIYATQQMCFNYFLVLSLGVIFLALSNAPETFAGTVTVEFHAALNLIQSLSSNSFVSRRLWKFVRGLRPLANRLASASAGHQSHQSVGVATTTLGQEEEQEGQDESSSFAGNEQRGLISPDLAFLTSADNLFFSIEPLEEPGDTNQLVEDISFAFEAIQRGI